MADKFISATQTQVATKVSTKTQVLLGLISGLFRRDICDSWEYEQINKKTKQTN